MEKILVTGGAGFIGSHLTDKLVAEGYKTVVYDNLQTGSLKNLAKNLKKIKFIKGDICDQALLHKNLKGVDYVFHLAALVLVPESLKDPLRYHRVNIDGTLNLLEACLTNKVKKAIFSSSCAVYGDAGRVKIKENHQKIPLSPYALSKLAAEYYFLLYAKNYNLDSVTLRYFNVYGPRQNPDSPYSAVIPKFIKRASANKQIEIYGDGNQTRDFIYIDDIVEANIKALRLKRNKRIPSIFNIGSGKSTSVNNLVKKIELVLDRKLKVRHVAPKKGEVRYSQADMTLAKKFLKHSPKTPLKRGLKLLTRSLS